MFCIWFVQQKATNRVFFLCGANPDQLYAL